MRKKINTMSLRVKNIVYTFVLLTAMFLVWLYRQNQQIPFVAIEGSTMGTSYHILYFDKTERNFKTQIDSLLRVFNQSLSTYISDAEISQFNNSQSFKFQLPYFYPVLVRSAEIYENTSGAFDPTVMPLVNLWGFGPAKEMKPTQNKIDSIMTFIGFGNIIYNADSVWKKDNRAQLDFSAIAKGYGVDVVADFLKAKGISNLFVEIGGEVVASGVNLTKNKVWEIGILDPVVNPSLQEFKAYVKLQDRALATSGNYFNFREIDGIKYSHTIDPVAGYPIDRAILSASVFANDCMTADAYATAFMVAGHEKAISIIENDPSLDAILIYSEPDGSQSLYISEGIKQYTTVAR